MSPGLSGGPLCSWLWDTHSGLFGFKYRQLMCIVWPTWGFPAILVVSATHLQVILLKVSPNNSFKTACWILLELQQIQFRWQSLCLNVPRTSVWEPVLGRSHQNHWGSCWERQTPDLSGGWLGLRRLRLAIANSYGYSSSGDIQRCILGSAHCWGLPSLTRFLVLASIFIGALVSFWKFKKINSAYKNTVYSSERQPPWVVSSVLKNWWVCCWHSVRVSEENTVESCEEWL